MSDLSRRSFLAELLKGLIGGPVAALCIKHLRCIPEPEPATPKPAPLTDAERWEAIKRIGNGPPKREVTVKLRGPYRAPTIPQIGMVGSWSKVGITGLTSRTGPLSSANMP